MKEVKEEVENEVRSLLDCQSYIFTASGDYEDLSKPGTPDIIEFLIKEPKLDAVKKTDTLAQSPKRSYTNKILNLSSTSEEETIMAIKAYMKRQERL